MRRKDREIIDFNSIIEIIKRCDTIRLGFADGDYPYIVPLSFGFETQGEQIYFYIHGATEGRKAELMKQNRSCSFEMDCDHKLFLDYEKKQATMKYSSLMGKVDIEIIEDDDKKRCADVLLSGYENAKGFEYNTDSLSFTMLARLTVTEYTAKSNIK